MQSSFQVSSDPREVLERIDGSEVINIRYERPVALVIVRIFFGLFFGSVLILIYCFGQEPLTNHDRFVLSFVAILFLFALSLTPVTQIDIRGRGVRRGWRMFGCGPW